MSSTSMDQGKVQRVANRRRSSSVTNALKQVPLNEPATSAQGSGNRSQTSSTDVIRDNKPSKPRRRPDALPEHYRSLGFWGDVKTGRWMLVPETSFKLLLIPVLYHLNHLLLVHYGVLSPDAPNPVRPLLTLSGQNGNGMYEKHRADWLFVAHQIIWWSFVRQFMTLKVFRPLAMWFGIKGGKIERFTERMFSCWTVLSLHKYRWGQSPDMTEGYAVFYMGIFSSIGMRLQALTDQAVMHKLPLWWYRTEHLWLEYPHTEMSFGMKAFYLLQASYWLQQTIILAAKIEKPRKDFKELVAHHIVTLYLIFWSYMVHLTHIGVAIFVTMDTSDVFLALAKCTNYVNETASQPVFAFFVLVWSYFRHYLNIKILWSVWTEFDLIPFNERQAFTPLQDRWAAPWLRYMIFLPIFLLQIINLFWYFLILRILYRAIFNDPLKDERSDDEDEVQEDAGKAKPVQAAKAE